MSKRKNTESGNDKEEVVVTDAEADAETLVGAKVGGFTVKAPVSLPFLKIQDGIRYPLRIDGKFIPGEPKLNKKTGEPVLDEEGEPQMTATTFNATLFSDDGKPLRGVHCVAPVALRNELVTQYPSESYVGKIFFITRLGKVEGKRYVAFEILEISVG
jgi:hypothetical protein